MDYPKNHYVLEKGGLEHVCKWAKGGGIKDSPHTHEE